MAKPKMIFVIFLATAALIQAFPQAGDSEKQETFDAMDKDGDGLLTKKEFRKGAKAQEGFDETIENRDLNEYFDGLDTNSDNKLNFEEFSADPSGKRWFDGWSFCLFWCG